VHDCEVFGEGFRVVRRRWEEEEEEGGGGRRRTTYNDYHDNGKIHQDTKPFQCMDGEEKHREPDDELEHAHPDPELGILWDMFLTTRPLRGIHSGNSFVRDDNDRNKKVCQLTSVSHFFFF
jgi:hypothetical protein